MIAWAGLERLRLGLVDPLDAPVRPRWPLDGAVGSASLPPPFPPAAPTLTLPRRRGREGRGQAGEG